MVARSLSGSCRRCECVRHRTIKALTLRLRDVMVLVESVATRPARLRVANSYLLTEAAGDPKAPPTGRTRASPMCSGARVKP